MCPKTRFPSVERYLDDAILRLRIKSVYHYRRSIGAIDRYPTRLRRIHIVRFLRLIRLVGQKTSECAEYRQKFVERIVIEDLSELFDHFIGRSRCIVEKLEKIDEIFAHLQYVSIEIMVHKKVVTILEVIDIWRQIQRTLEEFCRLLLFVFAHKFSHTSRYLLLHPPRQPSHWAHFPISSLRHDATPAIRREQSSIAYSQ